MKARLSNLFSAAPDETVDWFEEDKSILNRYVGHDAFVHAQIYAKLVDIFSVVFDGYDSGSYTFLPVDETLDDLYQDLRHQLKKIEQQLTITHLRIMDFKAIPTLNGHFQYYLGLWNMSKMMYFQDKDRLLKIVGHGQLPDRLRLQFVDIDQYLLEHKTNKIKLLSGELNPDIVGFVGIQFDMAQSTIKFQDSPWFTIQINQKEMQFLRSLVEAKGEVITYQSIAQRLNLNAAHSQADDKDLARTVQFLKRDLGKRLTDVGMSKPLVATLLDSIISIHGVGYKLLQLE